MLEDKHDALVKMANEKEVLSSTNRLLDERSQFVFFQKDEIIRELENKIEKERIQYHEAFSTKDKEIKSKELNFNQKIEEFKVCSRLLMIFS
jgi:hypothetical protein